MRLSFLSLLAALFISLIGCGDPQSTGDVDPASDVSVDGDDADLGSADASGDDNSTQDDAYDDGDSSQSDTDTAQPPSRRGTREQ